MDPKNMDEIKRMTHILEQATRMCDGKDINFKNILTIDNDIKNISLDQTKSIMTSVMISPNSPNDYLNGNQYQSTNDKEL